MVGEDPLYRRHSITDWEAYLTGGMTVELEQIRMATQTGRPLVMIFFVGKVSNLTGRDLSKGKAARPKRRNNNQYYVRTQ